ncbi:MAG TPA: fumarylacetoacetate hydrolase family protein [Actinomycetota bacterium]|nr:fumarylacetoacetate hydrolase family protein [Actinomycetota bacterium]
MKLVTYDRMGARRLGAWVEGAVVDLHDAVGHPAFPATLEALVARSGGTTLDAARDMLSDPDVVEEFTVPGARLLAPLLPSSMRNFLAYERAHEMPVYYKGNHRSVVGPDEEVPWPEFTQELDYEVSVGCVVGKPGRDLSPGDASRVVFGYTLVNDWCARDVRRAETAGGLGPAKSSDFATSIGPCIVTADDLDPSDLPLVARVDGDVWSAGNLRDARWSFSELIAYVSRDEEVLPGDVYTSGTFTGGRGHDVGRRLQPGQAVELETDGIGVLRNTLGRPGVPRRRLTPRSPGGVVTRLSLL